MSSHFQAPTALISFGEHTLEHCRPGTHGHPLTCICREDPSSAGCLTPAGDDANNFALQPGQDHIHQGPRAIHLRNVGRIPQQGVPSDCVPLQKTQDSQLEELGTVPNWSLIFPYDELISWWKGLARYQGGEAGAAAEIVSARVDGL
eukprot:scaffold142955_cov22-Tisochrysis_lutea.AAC.1